MQMRLVFISGKVAEDGTPWWSEFAAKRISFDFSGFGQLNAPLASVCVFPEKEAVLLAEEFIGKRKIKNGSEFFTLGCKVVAHGRLSLAMRKV